MTLARCKHVDDLVNVILLNKIRIHPLNANDRQAVQSRLLHRASEVDSQASEGAERPLGCA